MRGIGQKELGRIVDTRSTGVFSNWQNIPDDAQSLAPTSAIRA